MPSGFRISQLTSLSSVDLSANYFAILDTADTTQAAEGTTKRVSGDTLAAAIWGASALYIDDIPNNDTTLNTNSANWNSTYVTVNTMSSSWDAGYSSIYGGNLTLLSLSSYSVKGYNITSIPISWQENQYTLLGLQVGSVVTSIGASAFNGCGGFTGPLVIPSTVTTIGDSAFYSCSSFSGSLTITGSVSSIGTSTFQNCSGITNIQCYTTKTVVDAANNCLVGSGVITIHARSSDGSWTAGVFTIGGKSGITVTKDL